MSPGKIFAGYDIITGEDVAIKFEPQSSNYLHLENEYNIYKSIGNHIGVPRLKWFGQEHNQRVLVLSLLGPSLKNRFVGSGCRYCQPNGMLHLFLLLYTYFLDLSFPSGIYPLSTHHSLRYQTREYSCLTGPLQSPCPSHRLRFRQMVPRSSHLHSHPSPKESAASRYCLLCFNECPVRHQTHTKRRS